MRPLIVSNAPCSASPSCHSEHSRYSILIDSIFLSYPMEETPVLLQLSAVCFVPSSRLAPFVLSMFCFFFHFQCLCVFRFSLPVLWPQFGSRCLLCSVVQTRGLLYHDITDFSFIYININLSSRCDYNCPSFNKYTSYNKRLLSINTLFFWLVYKGLSFWIFSCFKTWFKWNLKLFTEGKRSKSKSCHSPHRYLVDSQMGKQAVRCLTINPTDRVR